ncbi:BON domain-containing protein [Rhodoferax ferrireducens]|uniref:BON domain-containing protein n=1 Tax=Rhodoferax ferrireducens TaxID=192843 RepID=UPI000E0D66C1|nr:BON domain-containing protein [Rhodoferax ferrireducens]
MKSLKIKYLYLPPALVLSVAGLMGCSAMQMGERAPAYSSSASAVGDPALATAVTDAIQTSLDDKARDIQVAVNDGVVMLSGWARQPSHESRARAVASRVPGVVNVYSRVHLWSSDDS